MTSYLQVLDYVLIGVSLTVSTGVGLYFGIAKRKNNSMEEYFFASRELSVFQLAFSMFATSISSGTLVGSIAEVYYYGTQSKIGFPIFFLNRFLYLNFFFPIFYNIGSCNVYKYYELRFNKYVRFLFSTLATIRLLFSSSVVLYGVSTSFSTSTGLNFWLINIFLMLISTSYSTLGGVRGVTLADMIQGFIILGSTIALVAIGVISVGGFNAVWQRNLVGKRIEFFNFDFNPTVRHTFWTATIGTFIDSFSGACTSSVSTLKLMASSTVKKSKRAAYISQAMVCFENVLFAFTGLVIFASFYLCDPKASGAIKSPNQMLSVYINTLTGYHGLAGTFYAFLFCAAISTFSTQLNTLSALIMENYVKPLKTISNQPTYAKYAKIITVGISIVSVIGTLLVQQFSTILQGNKIMSALTTGPTFSILIIGTLFPKANVKSLVSSYIIGIVVTLWIVIGSMFVQSINITKPLSTIGCSSNFTNISQNYFEANDTLNQLHFSFDNLGTAQTMDDQWGSYFPLSKVSFNWYKSIAILTTMLSFILFSLIFGADKECKIDINLISKPIQTFHNKLSKRWQRILLCDVYPENPNEQESQLIEKISLQNNSNLLQNKT